jgi:hypothetical protein
MDLFRHKPKPEQEEIELLKDIDRTEHQILRALNHLAFVKIRFSLQGADMPEGPVTLTVGQVAIASIDAFDQNGAPFTGPIPTPTWTMDNLRTGEYRTGRQQSTI